MKGPAGIRWTFFAAALMLSAGLLFLAAYRHPAYGRFAMSGYTIGNNTGDNKGAGLQVEKPQIDTVPAERVETATFALG